MPKSEIKKLKSEALDLYLKIKSELDRVDCGLAMLCYVRPSVSRDFTRFQTVWAKLREIDPECPPQPEMGESA